MPTVTVPQAFALALQHHQAGRLAEAEALYRHVLALQPGHVGALHYLGVLAHGANRPDLAVPLIRRAIVAEPNNPAAHSNLGEAYRSAGQIDEAIASFRRALELKSASPEVHNNLGLALAGGGRLEEAIAAHRQALSLKPDFALAHNNLGAVLAEQGRLEEAIAAYRRALELMPDHTEFHINLGNALQNRGDLDGAITCYERALALSPCSPNAHLNMGVTWWLKGRFPVAEASFRRSIDCRADFAEAHLNLGLLLLLLGRYEEGWHEYEWRWRSAAHAMRARDFAAPQWDGGDAAGKTILIHAEQGYGDTLLFTRYLPLVLARSHAAKVILECQSTLVPLLQQLRSPEIDVVARKASNDIAVPFDLHLPLFSMPLALRCFAPLPPITPRLQADAGLRAQWRERLGAGSGFRVGIAWAGNPGQDGDRRRSIAPEKLSPLVGLPGIDFVSLQIEPRGPLPSVLAAGNVSDFTADIANFSHSAALIAELDLIITVDTATAHLAGTLGLPVWVLAPLIPYWPYGLGGNETPWYPTMRLFRQSRMDEWDDVLNQVAAALRDWHA